MKKPVNIALILMLMLCIFTPGTSGQGTDCYLSYDRALVLYKSGISDSTILVLRPCLDNREALMSIPKETRARIYRLAAMSSIMVGNIVPAEEYIRQMLINQPDYKANPNPDDLMEFKQILDRIEVKPSLRSGIRAGSNYPFLKLRKQYSNYTLNDPEYSLKSSFGYQFGIFLEKVLTVNISIEAEGGVSMNFFNYEVKGNNPLISQDVTYEYNQKVTFLEIPVGTKYYFGRRSIKPYVEAGITGRILLNETEKSDDYGKYWFTGSENTAMILTSFLSDFNIGILAGGGAIYDLSRFSLRVDFRYNHYFSNSGVVSNFDSVSGYEDIPSSEKFHYTNNINFINLKNLQISAGLMFPLKYKVF